MKNGKKRLLSLTAVILACLIVLGAAGYGAVSFIREHPVSIVAKDTGSSATGF
jgi:hypothetical protein